MNQKRNYVLLKIKLGSSYTAFIVQWTLDLRNDLFYWCFKAFIQSNTNKNIRILLTISKIPQYYGPLHNEQIIDDLIGVQK